VPCRLGERLTARERDVLALIVDGASNKEGAHQLGISKRTFEGHRAHIMEKLGARNAADLGRLAQPELRDH
jgi:two-component system, LuxR family, response regulator FixJ